MHFGLTRLAGGYSIIVERNTCMVTLDFETFKRIHKREYILSE